MRKFSQQRVKIVEKCVVMENLGKKLENFVKNWVKWGENVQQI